MDTINYIDDEGVQIALFQRLKSTVEQADVDVKGPQGKALAYYVKANHDIYGDQCKCVIEEFIKKLQELGKKPENKACETSWALDCEIRVLFKKHMNALSAINPGLSKTIEAISSLYEACKPANNNQHSERKIVNYGWGIPDDLAPEWYQKMFADS